MKKLYKSLIDVTVLVFVVLGVRAVSRYKENKGAEEVSLAAVQSAAVQSSAAQSQTTVSAERPGGGPALVGENAEERVVSSPDGAQQELSEEDPQYRLQRLRLPRTEFRVLEDGTVEYQGRRFRRNNYVKACLLLGIDIHSAFTVQPELMERGVSDGIFLIVQDTAHNSTKVLMIPRDTITEIFHYSTEGGFRGEYLNHIALAYSQLADPNEGCANMVGAVKKLLCGLDIDGYAAINLEVLAPLTDAVGGVDVTIPNDQLCKAVPGWTEGKRVHLTGENVEKFLRYRDSAQSDRGDDTPIVRMSQHEAFLKGFYRAVREKNFKNSGILNELYDILQMNMITSMDKGELLALGSDSVTGSFGNEDVLMLPGEEVDTEYTEWYADYEKLIPLLLELFYRELKS